jgi:DNA polymerase eta
MVIERLLAKFPFLASVPDDAPDGMDSPLPPAPPIDWTRAGNVFPINGDAEDGEDLEAKEEERSEDGRGESDVKPGMSNENTWEDWALCLGAEIMGELRGEVWRRLHYTCSAVRPAWLRSAHFPRRKNG